MVSEPLKLLLLTFHFQEGSESYGSGSYIEDDYGSEEASGSEYSEES